MVDKNNQSTTNLLFKKTLRSFFKNIKQFIAVIFIATLAVSLFTGLSSNAISFSNRVDELYKGSNIADIWTTATSYESVDEKKINELSGEGSVTEKRFTSSAKLNGVNATALIYKDLPTINKPYWSDNEAESNFFILDNSLQKRSVEQYSKGKNATISLDTSSILAAFSINEDVLAILDELAKGDTAEEKKANNIFRQDYLDLEFTISGLMISAENIQNSSINATSFILDEDYFFSQFLSIANAHYTTIGYEIIRIAIEAISCYNQYCSKLAPGKSVKTVTSQIESYFALTGTNRLIYTVDINTLPSNAVVQSDIVQARQLTYIFPMVFFLVAILVILTTLSQIILKERTQIGTMRAIGISKTKIYLHYISLTFIVCLIGIILGIIIGPLTLPYIMNIKYNILYTLPSMNYAFPWIEFLACSIFLLLIGAIVTFFVTRKSVNLKPSESMRPASLHEFKSHKKSINYENAKKNMPLKMAFRNIRSDLVKSIMVIVGVMGCTALLVCGFGIDDTLNDGIAIDMNNFYNSDMYATYSAGSGSMLDDIKNVVIKDDSGNVIANNVVTKAEEYTILPAQIKKEKLTNYYVYGLEDNYQFFQIKFDKDKVAVSDKVARESGINVGDEFTFICLGKSYTGVVGVIFPSFSVHGVFINTSYAPYENIAKIKTNCWIDIDNSKATPDQVSSSIAKITGVTSSITQKGMKDKISSIMSSVSYMTAAVKLFAIFLAIVVLYNLVLLNYHERIRDIATLRVLGFKKSEIAISLVTEIMLLTIVGIVVGLFLGKPMEILVLIVNQTPLVDFLYKVNFLSYFLSFLITFGTALITNIVLSNMTGKVKMVESLKSIE
jgi:putative ABC transport system permease protein